MSVTRDILRAWRRPRRVMRAHLGLGQREDRALAFLMAACMVIFVAQWPRLGRVAHLEGSDLSQLMAYELFGWLFIWPMLFYGVAGISGLVLRLFGAGISYFSARLALFWALLASTPAMLFYGLLAGLNGAAAGTNLAGLIWLVGLGWIWMQNLREGVTQGAADV